MILSRINIELTDRCNKNCWCCGRRRLEKEHPEKASDRGDMPIELVHKIAEQVPAGTIVQLHNSGEPLLYPLLSRALQYFSHCITGLNTNAILLVEKAEELIGNIDSITISVIQGDDVEVQKQQRENVKQFLKLKKNKRPNNVVYRLLGDVDQRMWKSLIQTRGCGMIATRILHDPMGSFDYEQPVCIPETGICQDMLTSIAIDRRGHVSHCVRFDPDGLGVIGDLTRASLHEVVNGIESHHWQIGKHLRKHYVDLHVRGRREEVPLCATCHFYGAPTPYVKVAQ